MYPHAYIDYLTYFIYSEDYFECHEVLEEYWKEKPVQLREKHWVGLIQLAVGLYHERRGNVSGAEKMFKSSLSIISKEQQALRSLSIEPSQLQTELLKRLNSLKQHNAPFSTFPLPLTDRTLLSICEQRKKELLLHAHEEAGTIPDYLIHKHRLRDRSDVIEERNRQLQKRKQNK